jgi:hypothetical protein
VILGTRQALLSCFANHLAASLLFEWWNSKLNTNGACKILVDLAVSWHGSLQTSVCQVDPPRVLCTLAEQRTTIDLQVSNEIPPFHTSSTSRTKRVFAAGNVSRSTGSSIRAIASLRFARASLIVLPCVKAPGRSSVQATHHFPRFKNVPTYLRFAFGGLRDLRRLEDLGVSMVMRISKPLKAACDNLQQS